MTQLEEGLLELVGELAAAVALARGEFEELREIPQPMPDGLDARLTERLVLIETLKRVSTEGGALRLAQTMNAAEVRTFIEAVYREEREKAPTDDYELPGFPPLPEVEAQLDAAFDTLRRRRCVVPELYRSIDLRATV